jgi:hypothetical protein
MRRLSFDGSLDDRGSLLAVMLFPDDETLRSQWFMVHKVIGQTKGVKDGEALHVARSYAETATYGDGSKMERSANKMREYWGTFKSVAHFWAALRLNQACPFMARERISDMPAFLEVAEGVMQFATSFVPKRTRPPVPVVDPACVWASPWGTQV